MWPNIDGLKFAEIPETDCFKLETGNSGLTNESPVNKQKGKSSLATSPLFI